MKRREFITLLGGTAAVWPLAARAQQPGKLPLVGVLVSMVAGAPLQSAFIDSLARPGGNVTGLSGMEAEIVGKRLQLLRDLLPSLARVAVLASTPATDPFSGPFVENLRLAATRAGLRLEPILVGGPNEFESAFATMATAEAQARL